MTTSHVTEVPRQLEPNLDGHDPFINGIAPNPFIKNIPRTEAVGTIGLSTEVEARGGVDELQVDSHQFVREAIGGPAIFGATG
ncbi:hypothetical protein KY385_04925 [Candidatus Parcubacteria bacterium]|nr:hypothetical protein [Candidatus Parcubacteria bacterium]